MDTNTTPTSETTPEQAVSNSSKFKRINWKAIVLLVIILIAGGLLYYYKSLFVAATVNGHSISRVAVIKELEKQGGKDTLDVLITKQLINDAANSKGVTVSDDEVNQEIKKYETEFSQQGHTLDDTLAAQHLTRDDLKAQIMVQKKLDKLLGDKVKVSDEEVVQYIKDNKITPQPGQEDATKTQVKNQLQQQKMSEQSNKFITDLHTQAKIKRFVKY